LHFEPIGYAVQLHERDDGLYGRFPVQGRPLGDSLQ